MSARSLALKQRLKSGDATFGAWLSIASPVVAEIMAGTGYDWVLIDTEHGAFNIESLQTTLMTFNGSATVPIVRVAWNDAIRIKQVLDLGADGVLVPMVNTAAEAHHAVAACRYPPAGIRGFGPKRASGYGRSTDSYVARANDSVIVAVQIEHVEAAARIDQILDVPGIDVICLGPTDLSASAGVLRQFNHPIVVNAIDGVVAQAHARGLPLCLGIVASEADTQKWLSKGVNFVLAAEDTAIIAGSLSEALFRVREIAVAVRTER
jgi:4-hydroxy-2-oxoheptanedioate aldolase